MTQPSAQYGLALFGDDPYGSEYGLFGVGGAVAYTNTSVQVRFTDLIDQTDFDFLDPANYTIVAPVTLPPTPNLTVFAVTVESADSVVLLTYPQQQVEYTVTVTSGRSLSQIQLSPQYDSATFLGLPQLPTYFPAGTTPTRVRCIFDTTMQRTPATTLGNYTVTDLNGNVLPIVSVTAEQSGDPVSVVLTLSVPMTTTSWYQTVLSDAILSTFGYHLLPLTHVFQWVQSAQSTSVPIPEFSGEVQGGQFGFPNGLVFFSPSLNVAASNSVIQVEEVAVCTTAYDQYHFPQPVDPSPFYVWSPTAPQTFLGQSGIVLFAGFPRLSEATFELEFTGTHLQDQVPEAFDGSCSILMQTGFAPGYVALLNDPTWWMFDGTHSTTPPMFICANNLAPIPFGGEKIIILHCAIVAGASMTVAAPLPRQQVAEAVMDADSNMTTDPQGAGSSVANSFMRVARPSQNHAAVVSIVANSLLKTPTELPKPLRVSAWIEGAATVTAVARGHYAAATSIEGAAVVTATAHEKYGASVSILGTSGATASGIRNHTASASIVGTSGATVSGSSNHSASTAIVGTATVTAVGSANDSASASIVGDSTGTATAT
jgi:hypothetical protein